MKMREYKGEKDIIYMELEGALIKLKEARSKMDKTRQLALQSHLVDFDDLASDLNYLIPNLLLELIDGVEDCLSEM